ncbi:NAD(P)H-dependent flavin oxidoreductase [Candidatus Entotheonella palauensis]|uniref:NAD(P)H-dependent flavin oxidoreductase n=1 Tax=Candidatus Entotheonella palauensis TaxID=93172 RepID=UPI000B7FE570|nr:nitronate monooxygenase [Candidatus Entotheonella palauensis]
MRLHTPICDQLGIDYPIFAAGMGGVTLAPLTAAVSEAGGMGVLGATFFTPDELRQEIAEVQRLTDKPFGVDLLIPNDIPPDVEHVTIPPFPSFLEDLLPLVEGLPSPHPPALTLELAQAQVEVTLDMRVPVLVSALGTPEWLVPECRRVGTQVMSMVGSSRHARKLEELGVDVIIAQGAEAGGHVGTVTTMVLVPQVVDVVNRPVLAAGGIADGRGVAAALMLGAQGAWIGTRFIATEESSTHENHKRKILEAGEHGTVVSRTYTGKPSRILRNAYTERWKGHEHEVLGMPWQRLWVEQLVTPARAAGMVDIANYPTGQVAGRIADLPPAADIVARLVAEAEEALNRT